MIFSILFITVRFYAAQIHPEQLTISNVSGEHGILYFGGSPEQNETTQEQSSTGKPQLTNELSLSVHFYQEVDPELSPPRISHPETIKTLFADQNIESLSAETYQPVYTFMRRAENSANPEAQQQKFFSTLHQETVVIDTSIESTDTDLETFLAYGDLGPLSVADISLEAVSFDTDTELLLNDTYQFWNTLTTDAKHQQNASNPFAHSHTVHAFSDPSNEKVRDVNAEGNGNTACPTFSHSVCGQTFGSVCSICGQSLPQSSNAVHSFLNPTGKKPLQCDTCPKQFRTSANWKTHRRTHTGDKPFKCNFCEKEFSDRSNYRGHRRIHTGQKPFQCDICPKQFRNSADCETHRRKHTDEKPFQCDICTKQFRASSHYQVHRRIHTNEKPFQCDLCPKRFRTRETYQRHRRTHTGEKPYDCDICSKQFRTSTQCRRHRQMHTGEKLFQCDVCPKQFRTSSDYQRHRRTHTGEKPFQCDICSKQFRTSGDCRRHQRIHTGRKAIQM